MDKYDTYIISCIRGVRTLPFCAWVYLSVTNVVGKMLYENNKCITANRGDN